MGQAKRTPLSFRHTDTLIRLSNMLQMFLMRSLKEEHDVDVLDVQILMYVAQRDDIEQRCVAADIWRALGIPKATLLSRLKKLGPYLAEREFVQTLRGQKHLALTPRGGQLLNDAQEDWKRASAEAARAFQGPALIALGEALQQAEDALPKLAALYHDKDRVDWKFLEKHVIGTED